MKESPRYLGQMPGITKSFEGGREREGGAALGKSEGRSNQPDAWDVGGRLQGSPLKGSLVREPSGLLK